MTASVTSNQKLTLADRADMLLKMMRKGESPFIGIGFMQEVAMALRSADEKNDGSEVEDRPNPERSGSTATHNVASSSEDAGDKSPARSALTEAEQLLSAWADILPPNGHLYFEHTKRAREYFERRSAEETTACPHTRFTTDDAPCSLPAGHSGPHNYI